MHYTLTYLQCYVVLPNYFGYGIYDCLFELYQPSCGILCTLAISRLGVSMWWHLIRMMRSVVACPDADNVHSMLC
jgi:hypothetical protein